MAKWTNDEVLDTMLDEIALGNLMTLCNAQPTTRTEAVTTFALADVAMTPGDSNDYTVADGDGGGRKVTMAAKNAVDVDVADTGNHVAITDATRLLIVTTCADKVVGTSDQVNFPVWDAEVDDPA